MSPWSAARAALGVYLAGAAEILAQLLCRLLGGFADPVFPRQPGRVAIVTGGTEGIGLATCRRLALLGMHVIIAGNDATKGREAERQIREETGNPEVEFSYCDLGSLRSVREFVLGFRERKLPLHVLINNAGVMMLPRRRETRDGFEEHFGVNYLGHFLLTLLLLDALRAGGRPGARARVVSVSSATHYAGRLRLDDLQGRNGYSPHAAYAQSKLALVLFTYRLQALLEAQGSPVAAHVADPGVVDTALYRHVWWGTRLLQRALGRWLFKTPEEGARTPLFAALAPELEGSGGRYLRGAREARSLALTYDRRLQGALWAQSCRLARVRDPATDSGPE